MQLIFLSLLVLLTIKASSSVDDINVQKQKILDALLDPARYDKRVRPEGNGPTNVTITMYVLDIIDMDHYLKDFTIQCYFRQKWTDKRLTFYNEKSKDKKDIQKISGYEIEKIWTPDLFFPNEIKSEIHDIMKPNRLLRFKNNGEIFMSNRLSIILTCKTNLMFYPHDEQKCYMTIESYGFAAEDLTLDWGGDVGITKQLSSASNYILLGYTSTSSITTVNKTDYTELKLEFHFSRNFQAFLVTVYLPHIFLVIMSWAAFCIDHKNTNTRLVYLGLLIFLTIRLIPDDKDPDFHIRAFDVWIGACLLFLISTFLESIFVGQMGKQEEQDVVKEQDAEEQAVNSGNMNLEKEKKSEPVIKRNPLFARISGKYNTDSKRFDAMCRIISPLLFLLFNIVYWTTCCCASKIE